MKMEEISIKINIIFFEQEMVIMSEILSNKFLKMNWRF